MKGVKFKHYFSFRPQSNVKMHTFQHLRAFSYLFNKGDVTMRIKLWPLRVFKLYL